MTETNDKGTPISRVHEWWKDETFIEDDSASGGYYEDAENIEAPYYPDIAAPKDYLSIAKIVAKSFNKNPLHMLNDLYQGGDQWHIIREPDRDCGMGCCLRHSIGSPVAVASVDRGETWWITRVAVEEDERHKGLGTLLLECIVDAARRDGITDDKIMLTSEPETMPFYTKMGWVEYPFTSERAYGLSSTCKRLRRGHPA